MSVLRFEVGESAGEVFHLAGRFDLRKGDAEVGGQGGGVAEEEFERAKATRAGIGVEGTDAEAGEGRLAIEGGSRSDGVAVFFFVGAGSEAIFKVDALVFDGFVGEFGGDASGDRGGDAVGRAVLLEGGEGSLAELSGEAGGEELGAAVKGVDGLT